MGCEDHAPPSIRHELSVRVRAKKGNRTSTNETTGRTRRARSFDILLRLLIGDVKSTVTELVRLAKSRPPSTEPIAIGCRVMGLLCALHRLVRAAELRWPELEFYSYDTAFGSLIDAYNALSTDTQADCIDEDWCPGLRTAIIATICTFVDVQVSPDGKLETSKYHLLLLKLQAANLRGLNVSSRIFV